LLIDFAVFFFDFIECAFALLILRLGKGDFFLLLAQFIVTFGD